MISWLHMPYTISPDDVHKQLISATEFRRRTGRYLDKLAQGQSFVIIRGNIPLGTLTPLPNMPSKDARRADIEKIKRLSGGFHFKKSLTPKQLNNAYDKMYDEMLLR